MMEELQEGEVLWADDDGRDEEEEDSGHTEKWHKEFRAQLVKPYSGPIKIPAKAQASHPWTPSFIYNTNQEEEEEEDYDDRERTPPHIIMARRITDKMAFSVCVGIGRTLKGRDLSRVRNSVLRMTGFLER